eukprot:1187007-Pyramimonas_sp.AAC.1
MEAAIDRGSKGGKKDRQRSRKQGIKKGERPEGDRSLRRLLLCLEVVSDAAGRPAQRHER